MVYIEAYGGKPVHNLGSCLVYMHNGHKIYRVLCQVTDTKGYFILDREQSQQMNYIQYQEIQSPKTSLRAIAVESDKRSSSQVKKTAKGRQMRKSQRTSPITQGRLNRSNSP